MNVPDKFILPDEMKMKRILHVYGIMDPEVGGFGYHQGYPNIVTLLLKYISPAPTTDLEKMSKMWSKTEEDVFYCLHRIMHGLNWREHYLPPYSKQKLILEELTDLVLKHIPELYAKLDEEGYLEITMYNLYNFCMMSICGGENFPVDVTARIFELVIFEGLGDASLVRLIIYMLMI